MNSKLFSRTGALSPGRSMFNLSYSKTGTCDMGQLIPVMCDEVVPGDIFQLGAESVLRFQPLVAPILHEINVYVHYFFVPYRILWESNSEGTDGWVPFITRGKTGNVAPAYPVWAPNATDLAVGSLWDYLGLPMSVTAAMQSGAQPSDFPRRAYNKIFNDYYRDENLVTEVALDNRNILNRAWEKDYFTAALPWQQRGTSPSVPLTGSTSADWADSSFGTTSTALGYMGTSATTGDAKLYVSSSDADYLTNIKAFMNGNTVDLSTASSFDASDIRTVFQIQKWMERNARGGYRYTEFLRQHFLVAPRDERLQRPEYIGGTKAPVIVSEVLQTSQTDAAVSPQGNMAGHGIAVSGGFCGKYHAQEYGLIMGIMSIMPRTIYNQGIDRQWLRRTPYDHYFREFANLSEQEVFNAEIYAQDTDSANLGVFGFQGRYNEMRSKNNMIVGEMRSTFDYWHLARSFTSLPTLNDTFVTCDPRKDIFAVQDVPGILFSWGNKIKAFRPMPVEPVPGLIDHF